MNNKRKMASNGGEDDLFAGRGSPAFMSQKEPAIRLLNQNYSESFALTETKEKGQTHLFLIKFGLWALCYTFTRRDLGETKYFGISETLKIIEEALSGENPDLRSQLDLAIKRAKERVIAKARDYNVDQ